MQAYSARTNLILVTLLGLIWGLNWPIVKFAIIEYGPWTTRAISLSGAAAVMVLIAWRRGDGLRIPARQWWRVLVPAIFGMALVNILNAYAQMVMETGRTAIIAFSMPVWATAMSVFFLGERMDARKSLSLSLGVAGLITLAWPTLSAGGLSTGVLLALASALSWACGAVFMKRFPVDAPPLTAATWQIAVAAVLLSAGMAALEGVSLTWSGLSPGLGGLAYNIVAAQALGTWIWFGVLARSPASVAAIGTLMTPGVGVVGAMLLLGETPSASDWLGLALVVSACAIALAPRPAASAAQAAHSAARSVAGQAPPPESSPKPPLGAPLGAGADQASALVCRQPQ